MGGPAGVVIPQGVLFGSSNAFITVRKLLLDKCELKAVIAMPSGVFKPYAGVASAILLFTKGGETKDVWFYEMQGDGYSLDDKRNPKTLANGDRDYEDLHVIIDKYKKRNPKKETDRTQQHFFVPKQEIIDNGYDLSSSKYKEKVYEEIKYEKPSKILSQLSDLEVEIANGINELKELF